MPIINHNGDGEWSCDAVMRRYEQYCHKFHQPLQRILRPTTSTRGMTRWIDPIMDIVIEGIKQDDPACTEIGIDFICESRSFPFGMTLKSNTARALRKATMTPAQLDRVRHRIAQMLQEGHLPQEYRFYARLFRRTGLGIYRNTLLSLTPRGRRMAKYVNYVKVVAAESAA